MELSCILPAGRGAELRGLKVIVPVSAGTDFLKDVPSQILRNGVDRWMSAYQRFFKKLSGRPTIKKKHGRQSVMITKELFTFYSVDPKTAMINLGTKKHPIGPI